jgi:uncharacterized protein with HEPN domain
MARIRDKMIHGYFGIDYSMVWEVIKEQLPSLKVRFQEIYIEVSKTE